jgi:hypothetical protein
MELPDALAAALAAAPRRYRMPPLPADAAAAAARGVDTALAFAIEAARTGQLHGLPPPRGVRELFIHGLAQLIRAALAPRGGDPAFQALVLQAQDDQVAEYVRLGSRRAADERIIRAAVAAIAHPGKLRAAPAGPMRDALERLHNLTAAQAWLALGQAVRQTLDLPDAGEAPEREALRALQTHPALEGLRRMEALHDHAAVQRYRALGAQQGPAAGSAAAAAQGRSAARAGANAERATAQALQAVARWLNSGAADVAAGYRVLRSLRTPAGFPGDAGKAKDEWDAAIVHARGAQDPAAIVLLAEVKASAAAATSDASRLYRGLLRLALARQDACYLFPTADGPVRIGGASLRALRPHGRALPPQVIYCCTAQADAQPQVLSAATKAVLLAEPASLAFADQLHRGTPPSDDALAPVWDALTTAPRLRSALHQWDTARAVRDAMLHPEDLLMACGLPLTQKAPSPPPTAEERESDGPS